MTHPEQTLIFLLSSIPNNNIRAHLLQSYIVEEGPLTEEAAAKVRDLLFKETPDE